MLKKTYLIRRSCSLSISTVSSEWCLWIASGLRNIVPEPKNKRSKHWHQVLSILPKTILMRMMTMITTMMTTEMIMINYDNNDEDNDDKNWMAWCKVDLSDFFRWNFFPFKIAWIFACAFQLSRKTFPCIFFGWFALCSEKNKDKILKRTPWTKQGGTRGNFFVSFFALLFKKSRHFWGKRNSPKIVTYFSHLTQLEFTDLVLEWEDQVQNLQVDY